MASKINVMPQKEEMREKEGPETQSDRPLLDLSAVAVKELIRNDFWLRPAHLGRLALR